MSGSTSHITSNRNNRNLQKGARKAFFKTYKLTDFGRRGQGRSIELSENQNKKANYKKIHQTYVQLGIVFIVFFGLWWYVISW